MRQLFTRRPTNSTKRHHHEQSTNKPNANEGMQCHPTHATQQNKLLINSLPRNIRTRLWDRPYTKHTMRHDNRTTSLPHLFLLRCTMPQCRHKRPTINNCNTRSNTIPSTIYLCITTNNTTKSTFRPSFRGRRRLRSHLSTPHANYHRHTNTILKHNSPICTTKTFTSTSLQFLIHRQNILPSHMQ